MRRPEGEVKSRVPIPEIGRKVRPLPRTQNWGGRGKREEGEGGEKSALPGHVAGDTTIYDQCGRMGGRGMTL